ncbi:MAG TPA: alpha-N-arabinofuranosidase [Rectinemataceae bacterium]|nr:alpha-N-arabinofuranosidase [Rectinemataceae bacterium]
MKATLHLDREFTVGEVDRRLFGSFIEHLGRAVYGGIYEPGHPEADESGFRRDVIELIRELGISLVRYPGGNFVSSFKWEDSVGPRDLRPRRLDLAWRAVEPNLFGLNEFMAWSKELGTETMLALNLGTRGIEAASELVEYCNHPGGSYWSDLRRSHGAKEPHNIRLWSLGNELDGPWQVGQKTAEEYGRLAYETAKALKLFDPSLELIAVGSSFETMPTFPQWEATVLDHCYEKVDYLSMHRYYNNRDNDLRTFLGSSIGMEQFIRNVVATCDYAQAKKRGKKRIDISFDEWNVWFHSLESDKQVAPWTVGPPLLEDVYTFEDALVVGTMINTLLRHADRVKIACMAQLVNVIAPIMTRNGGPSWRQTIFYPLYHASKYGRGISLEVKLRVPCYENATYGEVPWLDVAAVGAEDGSGLTLFAVNRSPDEPLQVEGALAGWDGLKLVGHTILHHEDIKAVNDEAHPKRVVPSEREVKPGSAAALDIVLPPLSWNVLRFEV